MLAELSQKLLKAARVLDLILLAARAGAVDAGEFLRTFLLEAVRHHLDLAPELLGLFRLGAETDAAHHQRERALGIVDAEMQRRKAPHRQADNMRLVDVEAIHHV